MPISLVTSNHAKGNIPVSCSIDVSGTNKLVILNGLITGSGGDPGTLTPTFDGNAPTGTIFNTLTNTYYRSFMYYWLNPADGTKIAQIMGANPSLAWLCASCWQEVNQASPFGTLKTGNALALTGIACAVGDLLVDLLTGTADSVTGTKDANWTNLRKDYLYTTNSYGNGNSSYKIATSTSESSTWTGSLGTILLHNAIPILASGVSGILTPMWFF